MCCMFCVEIAKELVTPKQVWSLYRELLTSEDTEHVVEFLASVSQTSETFQNELAKEIDSTR